MAMRILVAQLDFTIGDFEGNVSKIISALDDGRRERVDIVLFSELAVCGYPPEDLLLHNTFISEAESSLKQIIAACRGISAVVGTVRRDASKGEKPLFNSAAVIADGALLGFFDKMLLPTYDVFDERRYFEPGKEVKLWEIKGKKVAVLICEDIWQHSGYVDFTSYQRDPVLELLPHKPDLLLNLSASPYHFQKPGVRASVCCKAAMTLHCPTLLCAQVGGNDQLIFDGYSVYADGKGEVRQVAKGFLEEKMVVDLGVAPLPFSFIDDPWRDLCQALVLGVHDYFHKLGFQRALIGLSGGIDSAVTACIAVEALGRANVLGIAMPSRYSSPGSLEDAKLLAERLGIELLTISIEEPFDDYLQLLKPYFGGRAPDVTEENFQARIRGMILMAISNKLGYVVISTGNKSEMAMGYCTLYGDMCGGLAAISDVTKTQVYALARWINRDKEIIPRSSIEKPPSAELRPNQKDTDTLPDYAIVDAVLQDYVEEHRSAEEIAKRHHLEEPLVRELIRKIHLAEYKRRQAPPGLRISKKAFRVGRRYPIVQRWV